MADNPELDSILSQNRMDQLRLSKKVAGEHTTYLLMLAITLTAVQFFSTEPVSQTEILAYDTLNTIKNGLYLLGVKVDLSR